MGRHEVRTTCMRDCPDACSIIATVEDGRVIGQRGDPEHGVTQGFLCARGNAYHKRQYDPARLRHPLRRTAGGWERIAWEQALDLVAEKLAHARDAWGPQSILALQYSGMRGWVAKVLARLFWARLGGVTMTRGGLSVEALGAAQAADFGADATHAPEDLAHSRAVVVWGKNLAVTHLHWAAFVSAARKRGAKLLVIDPVRTATARKADHYFQVRPGTDGLLALGVARRLLERGAADATFVADHTANFDAFCRLAFERSLSDVAVATDLSVDQIEAIADCYAGTKPVATLVGLGPSYWPHGGASVRLIDALAALTGNIGISGGRCQHRDIPAPAVRLVDPGRRGPERRPPALVPPTRGRDPRCDGTAAQGGLDCRDESRRDRAGLLARENGVALVGLPRRRRAVPDCHRGVRRRGPALHDVPRDQ